MWSNLYWYYEIRKDASYGESLPTERVLAVLEATGALTRKDKQTFTHKAPFPWVELLAVNSDMGNFGSSHHFNSETVNLVSIVGSRYNPENEQHYIAVFSAVARELGWEFILESDDDGNEDVVLCKAQY